MRKWCKSGFVPAAALLVIQVHAIPAQGQAQQYYLTAQPGPKNFAFSQVQGINNAGTGVGFVNQDGYCCDSSFLGDTAFTYKGATGSALEGVNGQNGPGGHANAINNSGLIVGYDFNGPGFAFNEAVIWENGTPKELGFLFVDMINFIGVSEALAINDSGVVVGDSSVAPPASNPLASAPLHAFSWRAGGKLVDLGALAIGSDTESSQANAISPSGIIVGQSVNAGGFTHAVQFADGKVVDLGALDGAKGSSEALGANDTEIVGDSDGDAVIWKGGRISSLPTVGGTGGSAMSINATGSIVGFSVDKAGDERATLWQNGKALDLNTLVTSIGDKLPAGTFLDNASQITDNGLIEASYTAVASDGTATVHSYLLTPAVPTHVTVSSTANPSSFGESVKLIIQVVATAGAPPVSSVTIKDGSTVLGKQTIGHNGFAGFTTSALTVGPHNITVSYAGSAPDGPSTSPILKQTVMATTTKTVLSSSANPVKHGQKFVLTAIVVPAFGTVAGSVTFKAGTTVLGTAKVDARAKEAALATTLTSAGKYPITASFTGSAGFSNSQSATLTEVVN
jgi:probable HAF family extracellular repeat protein